MKTPRPFVDPSTSARRHQPSTEQGLVSHRIVARRGEPGTHVCVTGRCEHLLIDVVGITILAVLCGADDFVAVENYAVGRPPVSACHGRLKSCATYYSRYVSTQVATNLENHGRAKRMNSKEDSTN